LPDNEDNVCVSVPFVIRVLLMKISCVVSSDSWASVSSYSLA